MLSSPSDKPSTTSGTVNVWGNAEWQLSVDSGFVDKQESSVTLQNIDVEQGPTNFTLEGDTEYWVRTRYNSSDPAADPSEWSEANKFKTAAGGGGGGAYGNFSTTLYSGTDSAQSIENGVDNSNKALVWIKNRASNPHALFDTERGVGNYLQSDTSGQQSNNVATLTAFNSNGFEVGASYGAVNGGGLDFVAWNFAAGEGFFDIVTYTGTGSPQAVPHSLGSTPGFTIVKTTSSVGSWYCLHKDLSKYLLLEENLATDSTSDKSSIATVDSNNITVTGGANVNSVENVAYLFADNPDGGIKCASYTGNGSSQTIDVGFKPGWLLIKNSDDAYNWFIFDRSRGNNAIFANKADAAKSFDGEFSWADNGFNFTSSSAGINASGNNYIYIAIADNTVRFYDEAAGAAVTNHTLIKRYGVDPLETDLRKFGIFLLTEQPTYSVDTYIKEDNAYKPIRNYTGDLNRAQREAAEANTRFDERDAQIRKLKIEVAKAVALEKITTAMEERLAALEDKKTKD